MNIYERVDQLRQQQGLSFNVLEKNSGLIHQTIEKWKDHSVPSVDDILKLAQYFNVSTDYLLGLTNNPTTSGRSGKCALSYTKSTLEIADLVEQMSEEAKAHYKWLITETVAPTDKDPNSGAIKENLKKTL